MYVFQNKTVLKSDKKFFVEVIFCNIYLLVQH